MDTISVLVCDDSALMRNLISRIVNEIEGMHVVATAMNGRFALEKIPLVKPDVIILDIEMPVMNGVEFLRERKIRKIDIPVIILSSVATQGAAVTIQCLELGASDFITKPGGSISMDIGEVSQDLIEMISSYGGVYARRLGKKTNDPDFFLHQIKMREAERFVAKQKGEAAVVPEKKDTFVPTLWTQPVKKEPAVIAPLREGGRIEIIALGISTGGPNALRDVFKMIDPHMKQPVLVVQHMPAGFTAEFANSLDRICPLTVTEAKDGEPVESGHIYIAPGNYHIYVEKKISGAFVRLSQDPPRNGHRPSADYLFESVAKNYLNHALGVIMTGMGRDGAAELAEMRRQGAWTLGQDEASAIVYGMPKVAWEMGAVQRQVPLMQMADAISALAREHA
ncbi:MAG: chemotaxis response regulator protein-glutamate methylesterase [Treponema sp.]|nr:chemotaxis response regulator protein-glutamate methylesterase [Treponema sp.]